MKRFAKILLCMAMVVLFCVAFSSCGECDHKWGDWTTVKAATCTEAGSQSRTCKDCGETETAEIPAGHQLGHWHEAIAADCTNAGSVGFYHCSGCGASVDANGNELTELIVPALGHTGGSATCEERAVCTRCSQPYGGFKSHSYTEKVATDIYKASGATCETAATYYYSCVCGEASPDTTFSSGDPLDHAYPDAWTSNHDGTHSKVCGNDPSHVLTEDCDGGEADCENKAVCESCHTAYGNYGDHDWNDGEVTTPAGCLTPGEKTFACDICGETKTEPIGATGHSYSDTVTPPTCTENGYTTHTCGTCGDSYVDTEVVTSGHVWDRNAVDCEHGRACTVPGCGATEPELGHSWSVKKIEEATCQKAKTIIYECSKCYDTYEETEGTPHAHDIEGVDPTEELVPGETCKYVLVYKCNDCSTPVNGETVYHHDLVASVTIEATCVSDGLKTLSCSKTGCNHSETEPIAKNENGHKWNEGVKNGNIVTYTCTNTHEGIACTATYTAVDASDKTETEVKAEDLAQTGDVQLKDAALGLDDKTIESLGGKDVTLSAGVLEGEDLDAAKDLLDDKQLEQLGNSPIYNFTMHDGANFITSFEGGKIKVTIPYTPAPDEDVDSIAIWYISEGKPVSIKATYCNGYVTFETDHFSYYTVTRLTPEERCALYEHSYTSTKVAPTCTEDGYTLHVCIRCGKTEKSEPVAKLGHDYKETETPATCTTAGKIVSKCETCKHTYQTKIPALGHEWGDPVVVEATCNTVGTKTYTCTHDGCGQTRVEKLAKLKHDMTETVVPPTCEDYGYTRHTCQRDCGYSYDDTIVAATGHNYTHTWEWTTDLTGAKVIFVCQNDANHTFEQTATVTVVEITSGCSAKNRYDAKLVYNGTIYTDTRLEAGEGTPNHNYSTLWKYDDVNHWHECVCGDKADVTEHAWNDGTVTKKPTCSEEGVKTYLCACGAQKTEAVPATGEHSYENGKCVDCGADEPSGCDHTELHRVFVDLKDYGTCGGRLVYSTCACGEVQVVDSERSYYFACDTDHGEEEDGEDENGEWSYGNFTCPDCGLYAEYLEKEFHDSENCRDCFTYTIMIKMGDTVLMNATYEDSEEEHDGEEVELDMGEFTPCGGMVTVYKCKDCGEICELGENSKVNCKFGLPETKTETDENGNPRMTMTVTCSVCGLKQEMVQWVEKDGCIETVFMGSYIYMGDECVFSYEEIMDRDDNHEWEYKFEEGASCDSDSVYYIEVTCKHCDLNVGTLYRGCFTTSTKIDLSDFGFCGGIIHENSCLLCGDLKSIHRENVEDGCQWVGSSSSIGPKSSSGVATDGSIVIVPGDSSVILPGGSIGTLPGGTIVFHCQKCGGEYYHASTTQNEGCVYTTTYEYHYAINGETVYHKSYTDSYENHDYEYTYEKHGETCDDGYTVTAVCKNCGDSYTDESEGHRTESEYEYIGGFCGISAYRYVCQICKEVVNVSVDEYGCEWEKMETNAEGYDVYQCSYCGGIKHVKTFSYEKDDYCWVEETAEYVYFKNGKEVFRANVERSYEDHDLDIRYETNGGSCEDGYTVYQTCKTCDYESKWTTSGHRTESTRVDLGALGFCGGDIEEYKCVVCGAVTDSYENTECNWYGEGDGKDGTRVEHCYTCGGERHSCQTVGEKDEHCGYLVTNSTIYYINGEEVHRTESSYRRDEHDYDLEYILNDGESCDNGYRIIGSCKNCGKPYDSYGGGHRQESTRTELSEYGFCGGFIEESYCTICQKKMRTRVYDHCDWEYVEVNEDGYTVYKCRQCHLGKLWKEEKSEKDENCTVVTTTTYVYLKNGEELFRVTDEYYDTYHEFDYHFDMLGDSCEDGYYVSYQCKHCGYGDEEGKGEYREGHGSTYLKEEYNLEDYGCCGGTVAVYGCACGQYQSVQRNYDCSDMRYTSNSYPDGDKTVYVETHSCTSCGFRYTRTWYSERDAENCQMVTYNTYTYSVGNQLITTIERNSYETSHRYEITGTLDEGAKSCEDGVIITHLCLDCGYRSADRYTYHEMFVQETIDLSELGSVCGGYAEVLGCACGRYTEIDLEHSFCDRDERGCDLWIEDAMDYTSQQHADGYHYFNSNAYIITCAVTDPEACGFKIRYAIYYKLIGDCKAQRYETWQFGYNEETDTFEYEITFAVDVPKTYHAFVREEIDTETVRGYRDVCSDCGSYNERLSYYNENGDEIKDELKRVNLLNDGNTKSYQRTYEYIYYLENGVWYSYQSLDRVKTIYGDDSIEERVESSQPYTPEAGRIDRYNEGSGRKTVTSTTERDGTHRRYESAYVYRTADEYYYNYYEYVIYTYKLDEDGYWERYDYSYDFTNGCVRSYVYTNSKEVDDTGIEDCHHTYWRTKTEPTCTQDGEAGDYCNVCQQYTETWATDPTAHEWFHHDGMYVCRTCGLHNVNGASGEIVMEDLTEKYGEGTHYVVGYWNRDFVKFVYNVTIILENGEEILLEKIDFSEQETPCRAIVFSRDAVHAAAEALGYSPDEYVVRFAFVPLGADSSFDYAITFTDDTETPEVIEGDVEFLTKLGNEGQRYTYTATEDVWLTFTTYSGSDTYGYLEYADGNYITSEDYGGEDGNFKIVYLLTAGETYTLGVRLPWNDYDEYVYVSIAFSAAEPSEEEPKDEEGGVGDEGVIIKPVDPELGTDEEGGVGDDVVIMDPVDPETGADENGSIIDGSVTEKDETGTTESEKEESGEYVKDENGNVVFVPVA